MTKRQSTGIFPALVFVAVILIAVFYVSPLRDKVDSINKEKEAKNVELVALTSELTKLQEIDAQLPTDTSLIKNLIPKNFKEKQLIDLMEKYALQNNISYNSLSFSAGQGETDKVTPITVSTSFQGTYQDLLRFLETLEKTKERKFTVRSINVSLTDQNIQKVSDFSGKYLEKALKVNFTLQLETYYQGVIN